MLPGLKRGLKSTIWSQECNTCTYFRLLQFLPKMADYSINFNSVWGKTKPRDNLQQNVSVTWTNAFILVFKQQLTTSNIQKGLLNVTGSHLHLYLVCACDISVCVCNTCGCVHVWVCMCEKASCTIYHFEEVPLFCQNEECWDRWEALGASTFVRTNFNLKLFISLDRRSGAAQLGSVYFSEFFSDSCKSLYYCHSLLFWVRMLSLYNLKLAIRASCSRAKAGAPSGGMVGRGRQSDEWWSLDKLKWDIHWLGW